MIDCSNLYYYFVEPELFVELALDPLWFNGAPPINLLGEDDAFLVVSIPDVVNSFGEALSPPVLFTLVGVLPDEFWAYTLDTFDGVAIRLNDSSDILKVTPATLILPTISVRIIQCESIYNIQYSIGLNVCINACWIDPKLADTIEFIISDFSN